MYRKHLTLDSYNGTLMGIVDMPTGIYDTSSPGGLSSTDHHWTLGLYGKGNRVDDMYFGTGERYVAGEYGNLYEPNAHSAMYSLYGGPSTAKTDFTTLTGDAYYWNNMTRLPPHNPFTPVSNKL